MNPQEIFGLQQPPSDLSHLTDLRDGMKEIKRKFYEWNYPKMKGMQKNERVFAYELYHQFRLITEPKLEYSTMRFDGELTKLLKANPIDLLGIAFQSAWTQQRFTPDLVLHLGQENAQIQNQKFILEIKTKNVADDEFKKTFLKLHHYIRSLSFQYAVFVSVNSTFHDFKQRAYSFFNHTNALQRTHFDRIVLMNYNEVDQVNKNNNVKCISLNHLLNTWNANLVPQN
jgi:hypothetical protein